MLRLAHEPAPIDDGITVAEAARILGVDPSTVRELVRIGQVEGWHVGKHRTKNGRVTPPRGVRVSRGSCLEYRERNRIGAPPDAEPGPAPAPRARPRRPSAAHQEAVAYLRSIGVRV